MIWAWTERRQCLGRVTSAAITRLLFAALLLCASQAQAQVSTDCGDVVSDGVIDIADLDALRQFLAGDPAAPDLQGDPSALARCDVTANGLCEIDDYARIKRYMLDLPGGMNETCPLAGITYSPVALPEPTVDQASATSTDRASLVLSGTAMPDDLVRVTGAWGRPGTITDPDGTWEIEIPLVFGALNPLEVFIDYGAGYLSTPVAVGVTQTDPIGEHAVEGYVVDDATGVPIAGVTVTIDNETTTTDSSGGYVITGLPAGEVVVRLEHPSYVPEVTRAISDAILPELWDTSGAVVLEMTPRAPTTLIDTAGGTITASNGVELVIPSGSLGGPTEISLTEILSSPSEGLPVIDIGPGGITFNPPATLRIPTPLPPGTKVDLAQVDQAAAVDMPLIGIVDALGYIEAPIDGTNGDELMIVAKPNNLRRYGIEVKTEKLIANNCVGDEPIQRFYQRRAFTGVGGLIPSDDWQHFRSEFDFNIEKVWNNAKNLKSLRFEEVPILPIFIPEGKQYAIDLVYERQEVRQFVDAYLYPSGSTRLGQLFFYLDKPLEYSIVAVDDCPTWKATVWGDPHLVRFDHVGSSQIPTSSNGRYDFQAGGEFVLFKSTTDGMVVQARFVASPGSPSISVTKAAAFDLDGDRVMVDIDSPLLRVRVDGAVNALTVGLPVVLPGGGELERFTPANGQDQVIARWGDGSSMAITLSPSPDGGLLNLYPELTAGRSGKVQGLMGNANGIIGDDYNLRDGAPADPADLYTVYANSWRISQAESLFDYEPGEDTTTYNSVPPDTEFTLDDLDPTNRAAAEAICIAAGIDEDPLFSDCALDVALLGGAATGGALETLDQIPDVGTYVAVFGQANIFQAGQASAIDFGGGGGSGLLPTEVPLAPGTERSMRVLDRAGEVTFSVQTGAVPLDGVQSAHVSWGEWGGVAGPRMEKTGQLMGVFLDDVLPLTMPASFDCGELDSEFSAPEIGQVFCIGDGLSFANAPQTFFVPNEATRLFLGNAERLSNQVVEAAVHHLGDNFGTADLFALAPNPEGPSFISSPFDLPTGFTPSSGRVRVDLAGTNIGGNSVWVNGNFISYLPVTGATAATWTEDLVFTVDPSILLPTGNWIEMRASGVNLDDYLFKNLRFEVAPAATQLPEPSDTTPYHLGCNCGQFIGDGVGSGSWGLFALMPTPYGTSWASPPFAVDNPEELIGASVIIDIAQTDSGNNSVWVNGTFAGRLPVRPDGTVWSTNEEIPFDPSLLNENGNRVEVRSGNLVPGLVEVDDFMMRDVRIAVAPAAAVPPGGYADNSGIQELVIDFSAPLDSDSDGLGDLTEGAIGTDPANPDSDGDGINDGQEVNVYSTNPLDDDSDDDGFTDGYEINVAGTDPNDAESVPTNVMTVLVPVWASMVLGIILVSSVIRSQRKRSKKN